MKNAGKIIGGIFGILLFSVLAADFIFAGQIQPYSSVNVSSGDNILSFNLSQQINVSDLVKLNPEIETVSFKSENSTVGYVNIFGGIGKNFPIVPGKDYEIFSSKNATLKLP